MGLRSILGSKIISFSSKFILAVANKKKFWSKLVQNSPKKQQLEFLN